MFLLLIIIFKSSNVPLITSISVCIFFQTVIQVTSVLSINEQEQQGSQSVRNANMSSLSSDNMLRIVPVVEDNMTELNGAVSEETRFSLQNFSYLSWKKLTSGIYRALRIIGYNVNDIWKQRHELSI